MIFNYNQQDAIIFAYLFLKGSTCFGRFLRPPSGAHNCTHSFRYCQPVLLQAGIMDEMEHPIFESFISKRLYMFRTVPPPIVGST